MSLMDLMHNIFYVTTTIFCATDTEAYKRFVEPQAVRPFAPSMATYDGSVMLSSIKNVLCLT